MSKDIRRFSDKWLEVFDWFEANPDKEYVVETETKKRAFALRFEFYRARAAMQRDEGLNALYDNTKRREVIIEDTQAVFRLKDKTPLAELLDRSLKQADKGERA